MGRSWRSPRHLLARQVRAWQLLQLPRWLIVFVVAVVTADAAALALAARVTVIRPADLLIFGLLLACGAVTVEMTRRSSETALVVKNVFGVWELPMAILLPPLFVLLAPIPRIALTQWRIRKIAPHRRVFTAAALSLSYGSAYLAFHALRRNVITPLGLTDSRSRAAVWILAVAACFALQWVVNNCLVLPAVKGSDRSASIRKIVFARESMYNDLTEACVATLITAAIAVSPIMIIFALPFVTLLQRSSQHAQLCNEARVDAKTGLLNATAWRRESTAELARAQRTGSAVAVALIDIDRFKSVNDRYGHLTGDKALGTISGALRLLVREYDLIGRFGGDEFSLLLPQTDQVTAISIAERIRGQVASVHIDASGEPGSAPIRLTVSIGVAALSTEQPTELLAAADAALYRAKGAGGNHVWVTTDTASFGVGREVGAGLDEARVSGIDGPPERNNSPRSL
jgi:diguanylate cyclase (GGDEF)-like protein